MIDTTGAKILIIDDERKNRMLLTLHMTEEGYQHQEASSGAEGIMLARSSQPDLILLDAMMPEMDGFQVAMKLKNDPKTQGIPIIMVTALSDQSSLERGLACGIEEFISKPVKANEVQIRVRNLLRLKLANDALSNHNGLLDAEVQKRTQELETTTEESIHMLMRAAEYRDDETGSHVKRISYYCKYLAKALGMSDDYCHTIFFASPMHDVGKIGIPDAILLKAGGFEPHEWEIMKSHTTIGANILSGQHSSPYITMGKEIALSHHECWDGSGYPHGLKGEEIPLSARIMSICDVYDALRSERPYKKPFDHQTAMKKIEHGDDRLRAEHFDPTIKAKFIAFHSAFEKIFDSLNQ